MQNTTFCGKLALFARHLLATVAVLGGACAAWTGVYIVSLAWALLTGDELGGLLAYPFGLLASLGVGTLGVGLMLPTTFLAEWLVRKWCLPVLTEPVVGMVLLVPGCMFVSSTVLVGLIRQMAVSPVAVTGYLWLLYVLPWLVYWSIVQGSVLLLESAYRAYRRLRVS